MAPQLVSDIMTGLSVAAIGLNVILLPLIAFKSGKDIGSYKVLLFLYSLVAIVHTTVTLIMVPVFEPSEKGWLFYATVQRVSRELGSYLICFFSTCYIKLLLILTYSFIYRYFVMCSPPSLSWFHKPEKVLILVVVYFGILILCAGPVTGYMRLNPDVAANFKDVSYGDFHIELDKISYEGAPMFKNGHVVIETAIILLIWTTVIDTCMGICFFCITKIIRAFRSTTRLADKSSTYNKLQQRLFILLILQTMVPMVFTFIPALLSYGLAYLGMHAPFISQTSSALMPLAQVIDPILIFAFIGEYRKGLKNTFRRYVLRQTVITSMVREATHSNKENVPDLSILA